jgi:hypothetical protein
MNPAKRDCACAMRLSRKDSIFGFVGEDRFDEVTRYFTPPSDQENFHVFYNEADTSSSKG